MRSRIRPSGKLHAPSIESRQHHRDRALTASSRSVALDLMRANKRLSQAPRSCRWANRVRDTPRQSQAPGTNCQAHCARTMKATLAPRCNCAPAQLLCPCTHASTCRRSSCAIRSAIPRSTRSACSSTGRSTSSRKASTSQFSSANCLIRHCSRRAPGACAGCSLRRRPTCRRRAFRRTRVHRIASHARRSARWKRTGCALPNTEPASITGAPRVWHR